jgi:hypothetical protein
MWNPQAAMPDFETLQQLARPIAFGSVAGGVHF